MLFPNYIYKYILECIINYLYNSYNSVYSYSNNQILILATVNKLWFKLVGELVSKQLPFYNTDSYQYLNKLIQSLESPKQQQQQHNNYYYNNKLIKLNQSNKYFDSFDNNVLETIESFNKNNFQYNKIIIKANDESIDLLFNSLEMLPNNSELILLIRKEDYIRNISKCSNSSLFKYLPKIRLLISNKRLKFVPAPSENEDITNLWLILNKYTPKEIVFSTRYSYQFFITLMFEKSTFQNIKASDYLFPFKKEDLPSTSTNLEKFELITSFIELLNLISFENSSTTITTTSLSPSSTNKEKWNHLVSLFSNDKTLKTLTFNYQLKGNDYPFDEELFNSGLEEILTNSESLETFQYYIGHSLILPFGIEAGLCKNRSIKNLRIFNYNHNDITIKNILINNKSIRNLFIQISAFPNDIKLLEFLQESLIENSSTPSPINLYSITFYFPILNNNYNEINKLIQFVKTNKLPVQEINIFNEFKKEGLTQYHNRFIINNTIINIIDNQ